MNDSPAPDSAEARQRQAWRRNLRWICGLLAIWFTVTFVVAWFARELRFDFFGWPFSFWVGAQGALVVYVLMAALYAWRMNRADGEAGTDSLAAPAPAPSQGASRGTGADAA
ncbi:DUF4212 domain-containing protein [Cupriavidus sp. BIC8F]|uniref:DUF4212 domain-containing protein n=1 Tax=Cupriavidus sp. BIC8F TaxID=3079014 RepID=UPI0029160CAA|nr:DUF4212 domain-containing protein [Cupriavidus sp. BIC8F]